MPTGTIKRFNDEKGFGFIGADDGGEDVFCHRSKLEGVEYLEEGQQVEYEVAWDERKGKSAATWVTVVGGGGGGGGKGKGGKGKGGGKGYSPY